MLPMACIWNKNSFPALLAGSPVQASSVPRTAKFTPTLLRILTKAWVTALYRSSKDPAQPTQNRISGLSPRAAISAMVGTLYVDMRSEEHTSELQSRENLVCRLLLEQKQTCKT